MSSVPCHRALGCAAYLLAASLFMLGMSKPAAAQQSGQDVQTLWFADLAQGYDGSCEPNQDGCEWVEGTLNMSIIYSGAGAEIITYAETDSSYDLDWIGWDAIATATLYLNGEEVGETGAANCYNEWGPAAVCQVVCTNGNNCVSVGSSNNQFINLPVGYQNQYQLGGFHEVEYAWEYYNEEGQEVVAGAYAYLNTQVDLTANWPYISTITPSSLVLGTTGTMVVGGYSLLTPSPGCSATWTLTPANGITLDLTGGDCEQYRQANLSYSVNGSEATEGSTVTLTWNNGYGTNQGTFLVTDPSPVISSVVPSTLPQGATQVPVTITGTGFGTNPSVTFSDPNIVAGQASVTAGLTSNGLLAASQTITVNVTVGSRAAIGKDMLTVTSNGYGSAGGKPTPPPGGSLSATAPFTVGTASSYMPPPATILYFGQAVPATGQNVYVGQLISLDTNAGPPLSELEPTSFYWTFPPNSAGTTGTVTASLTTPLTTPATSGEVPTPLDNQASAAISFYWINIGNSSPATYTVQFQYCVNGTTPSSSSPQCSTLSTATFNVAAPTGVSLSTYTGLVGPYSAGGSSYLALYSPVLDGIQLTAHSSGVDSNGSNVAQSGSYQWVQLLNYIISQYVDPNAPFLHACTWFSDPNATKKLCGVPNAPACSPELDVAYPYGNVKGVQVVFTSNGGVANDSVADNPRWLLQPTWGEQAEWFNATMYLEWIPPVAGQCNPSTYPCTIPVPLGSVNWFWSGDGVNTLVLIPLSNGTWTPASNGTDWFEEPCAFCSQGQNVNNAQYPVALQAASPSETNNYSYVMWTYATPYPATCQFVY